MAHCPLPKSTELTDVLVDCDTNVLTIIQTSANGSESSQSVDLTCILPKTSYITDVSFDCDTGLFTITQVSDGPCTGGSCTETFTVSLACILEHAMPACDDIPTSGVLPGDGEIVICTTNGPIKVPPSALLPEFDCSELPTVCCPRPPDIGIIACNDGDLVVVPPTDLLTCDDIPSVFPPPADFEIVVCGGGSLIKIPPHMSIDCSNVPVVNPPIDPSYLLLCSEGGMIKIPYDPDLTTPPTIDINEGEGIDIDVSVNGSHTTYTISSDLCEYPDKSQEDLDNADNVYFPICIDGGNGKIPISDLENEFGGNMVDGHGTALSGDGTVATPHKVDIALCELNLINYTPAATLGVCSGTLSERMPAIKAGNNVTIDADGTLNVNIPAPPAQESIVFVNGGTPVELWKTWDPNLDGGTPEIPINDLPLTIAADVSAHVPANATALVIRCHVEVDLRGIYQTPAEVQLHIDGNLIQQVEVGDVIGDGAGQDNSSWMDAIVPHTAPAVNGVVSSPYPSTDVGDSVRAESNGYLVAYIP